MPILLNMVSNQVMSLNFLIAFHLIILMILIILIIHLVKSIIHMILLWMEFVIEQ